MIKPLGAGTTVIGLITCDGGGFRRLYSEEAQFLVTCIYKVVEDGKTNPTKKDDVNRLKNRGDFSDFLLADTGGGCRRIHNERSNFAADILREMTKEVNKRRIASIG